jgi:hypothetical protein
MFGTEFGREDYGSDDPPQLQLGKDCNHLMQEFIPEPD